MESVTSSESPEMIMVQEDRMPFRHVSEVGSANLLSMSIFSFVDISLLSVTMSKGIKVPKVEMGPPNKTSPTFLPQVQMQVQLRMPRSTLHSKLH